MPDPIDLRGPWRAIVRAPMVRMATPFMAGIAMGPLLGLPLPVVAAVFFAISAAMAVLFSTLGERSSRWERGLVFTVWCIFLGIWWQMLRAPEHHPRHISRSDDREGPWVLRMVSVNGTSGRVLRADADVLGRMRDGRVDPLVGRVLLVLMPHADGAWPQRGDRLLVDAPLAAIDRVPDPGGFDKRVWAASRGSHHEIFAPSGQWRRVDRTWQWTDLFSTLRGSIATWLEGSGLERRERALVKALVLGQRDELDGEQRDAFARSGTVHVLAVSGMHVGLIFAILSFITGWWGGGDRARIWRGVVVLLALWGYAGLTGASPSVLRATIMFSLFTAAGMMAQRTDHLNSLFSAAFLLLLWDPAMLLQIGFQLSFLAVLGIILFYRPIEHLWLPESRVLRHIWSLAVVSLSAQLLVTPVSLHLFKAFPVWFLPANIVVVTAVGLAVNGSVALLLLYKVPVVGTAITWCLEVLLKAVGAITAFIAALPGAYPEVRVGEAEMLLLYVVILGGAAWWQWRWGSMRWVTVGGCAMLLGGWAWQAQAVKRQQAFVLYDDVRRPLAAVVTGRTLALLGHPDSLATDAYLQRRVERHCRSAGLDEVLLLAPDDLHRGTPSVVGASVAGGGRWLAPGIDVAFHRGRVWHGIPGVRHQVVVLEAGAAHDAATLQGISASCRQLVIAGNAGWRLRAAVLQWCAENDVPVHDVRSQGAYVLTVR